MSNSIALSVETLKHLPCVCTLVHGAERNEKWSFLSLRVDFLPLIYFAMAVTDPLLDKCHLYYFNLKFSLFPAVLTILLNQYAYFLSPKVAHSPPETGD